MLRLPYQALITPVVACFCMLGVSVLQFPRLQSLLINKQTISQEVLEKDIQAEHLRLATLKELPSFGYDNLIADWVYLNFLQYFGDDDVRDKTGYRLSPEYFDIIIKHDPRFLGAYVGLSTSTSVYAAMPERSIGLMKEGLKSLSPQVPEKSYYVWRYKGIDELLFLGNAQAAQNSFNMAANWASNFSDSESKFIAHNSHQTAVFLSHNPDSKYARIATWAMILMNKVDEKTRKRAIKEIEALGGKVISTPTGNKLIFPPKD
ncbi:hypothetical protein H6G76_34690 [Nostoc sp. FACHB-152]|uniref:hypothetical protein n=1 Tax=unclassified Nostoc TaxID=2593658 RepID=UPI00168723FB|nr:MULTISPECIES: hypothetical protein [unclassified Nostoc]MBD2452165.1 hypothetical protein [Nostoc sp. FACHB-152]MBD2473123.1 hypothetical protein [Nostoc sp. FACHB-145]